MQDCFNQSVVRNDIDVKVTYDPTNSHARFSSGVPRDVVDVNKVSRMYEFDALSVTGQRGVSFPLNFSTVPANPTTASLSASITVNLLGCPPFRFYALDPTDVRKSGCGLCADKEYSFDGESCLVVFISAPTHSRLINYTFCVVLSVRIQCWRSLHDLR